ARRARGRGATCARAGACRAHRRASRGSARRAGASLSAGVEEGSMQDVELSCACGRVRGSVRGAAPRAVNHVFCYCDDCQAYLHHLDRADLMDAHGGSEIIQVGPSSVTFDRGADELKGVRLGPKGLFRWYASCCRTPLGNTLTPSI